MYIGIDLGTTYSCVAVYYDDSTYKIIPNRLGSNTTPSVVAFIDNEVIVGKPAVDCKKNNLSRVVNDVKRLIGKPYNDPTVQSDMKHLSYEIINVNNEPIIKIDDNMYSPEEISALILKYMKII
jgi:L1 cell adhesion molecule like protein